LLPPLFPYTTLFRSTVLLQDLDGQLLWHYPEDAVVQSTAERVVNALEATGFDPFVGRKLFWLARTAGLQNVEVQVECYHLIAGEDRKSTRLNSSHDQ